MSLEQLQTFVAVAETGALSGAARRLHLTLPPLSRRLSSLEDELDARLFDRRPTGMTLTEEGRRLLPHARAVLDAIDALREAAVVGGLGTALRRGVGDGERGVQLPGGVAGLPHHVGRGPRG